MTYHFTFRGLARPLAGVCAAATLLIGATGASAATYRFATNVSDDSTAGQLIQEFADSVAEKTEGRVTFKLFNNGVLGDQPQYFQQIQKGVIDAGLLNSGTLENVLPTVGVLNLPYIVRDTAEYEMVMTSPEVQEELFKDAAEKNFAPLGFIASGFRSIYTTEPAESMADLKGRKLRSIASPTYTEMLRLFGAVPTPLSFGELYAGLQQGVVDGAEGGLGGLYVAKFGEVAKYALKTNQTRLSDFVVTSTKFREKVGAEDLEIVEAAFEEVSLKSIAFADNVEAEQLQKAVDEMGVTVVDVDIAPFIAAVEPMYTEAQSDPDKKSLIETIFAIEDRSF
ncbi:TRAP transporter substrate-binding protein DctP [Pseudooceanicola algae]|uniref:Solute-binding protein n=1 Tax=Pseudooceanicola algae TaxID=1537215 RepID=A0A418SHC0_9RHOB|nr:TRAP transporter substrate-binding protein DctP [Pseudooceanicola algae]QPM90449.1 Solute-binding protein [Pseudooceanicola algae]